MKHGIWILLFLILFTRFILVRPNYKDGQALKINGTIYSEPSSSGSLLFFNLSQIKIKLETNEKIHYGDFVSIVGIYKNGELTNAKLLSLKVSNNIFTKIRKSLISFYESSLPKTPASLVGGITIGAKSNLSYNFKQKLVNSGTSHIVVASGTNVTILAGFLTYLFIGKFSRRKTLLLVVISIWSYTLITGFEAPIIRATIMSTIASTSLIFGKVANSLRYTSITALIMLILVPYWLTDIGFILSFATTI